MLGVAITIGIVSLWLLYPPIAMISLAGSAEWEADTNAIWHSTANWDPNTTFPDGIGQVATFGTNITANRTITIDDSNAVTVGKTVFSATHGYTISSSDNSGALVYDSAGAAARVTVEAGTTVPSFNTDALTIQLNDPLIVSNANTGGTEFYFGNNGTRKVFNNGNTITFSGSGNLRTGSITGSGGLIKNGTSTLTFDGFDNSDYTGMSVVNNGRVYLWFGHFGDGVTVTINDGGTVGLRGDWDVFHNFIVSGRGYADGGVFRREECQHNVKTRMTGTITLASNSAIWVQCMTTPIIITNVVSGPGGLENLGPGLLILTNAVNTYSGTTTVSAGTIALGGSLAHCDMHIASNATFNGNGILNYNIAADAADRITVHGTLNISNLALNLNAAGLQTLREYVVADYSAGTLAGTNFANVSLPYRWDIVYTGTIRNPSAIVLLAPQRATVLEFR